MLKYNFIATGTAVSNPVTAVNSILTLTDVDTCAANESTILHIDYIMITRLNFA
jgi:hypothetical protein